MKKAEEDRANLLRQQVFPRRARLPQSCQVRTLVPYAVVSLTPDKHCRSVVMEASTLPLVP